MPNKSLGQHWLHDTAALEAVADAADVQMNDTVLEIGPGLGTLTAVLLKRSGVVMAVEFDKQLAANLKKSFTGAKVVITEGDFLKFDLSQLTPNYKVAANLPYYITAPILQKLSHEANPPKQMGLLVQKEVAERLSAGPGDLSVLAISIQNRYDVTAGRVVKAELFTPKPKVDSQIISLRRRPRTVFGKDEEAVIKLAKAGFANKRKTLINSLAAGRWGSKEAMAEHLRTIGANANTRAQELSLPQWHRLWQLLKK